MLILRRRPGDSIRIGGDIEVRVLEAGPHRVKLGITAPDGVAILRGEVVLVEQQNRQAAGSLDQAAVRELAGVLAGRPAADDVPPPPQNNPQNSAELIRIFSNCADINSES